MVGVLAKVDVLAQGQSEEDQANSQEIWCPSNGSVRCAELDAKIKAEEEKNKNQADEIVERELEWFCVYEYHAI